MIAYATTILSDNKGWLKLLIDTNTELLGNEHANYETTTEPHYSLLNISW